MTGKDIEDELGAVEDAAGESGLEVAELGGREVVIEENEIGFGGSRDAGDLLNLAGANERGRIGLWPALHNLGGDLAASAQEQLAKFGERLIGVEVWDTARAGCALRTDWIRNCGGLRLGLGENCVAGTH